MFIPLHIYTEYSFLKSGVRIDKLLKKSTELGYKTIGISDYQNMMAFPLFNKLCKKYCIKPIFGFDFYCEENHYSLYVKNEEGYHNLCKLALKINDDNFEINKTSFNGLITVINTDSLIFNEINKDTTNNLFKLSKNFTDFYIGLNISSKENATKYNLIRDFAENYSYKVLAFPSIKYIEKKDAIVLDLLSQIQNNSVFPDLNIAPSSTQEYFKTNEDITKLYSNKEINETENMVNSISFNFDLKRGKMLHYPLENNETSEECLIRLIKDGANKKHVDIKNNEYRNRLNYEYSVIKKMGYCDYFLIVQDYVNYAKNNNIPVGPGRGSACGSLVSYILNITEVDPLKYGLLFERFLNPERQSMPDIDIDFSDQKRELVIDYLKNKYGSDKVANIVTVQTFGARQALRDVGRIFGLSQSDISLLSKFIIEKGTDKLTLEDAYKKFPNFKREIDGDEKFSFVFKNALLIEGLGRQPGINAAGMVFNDEPLCNDIPLINDTIGYITQYEKDYLEDQGFLKMDLLGLINLSTIEKCVNLVKSKRNIDLDLHNIDLDDKNIYKLIQNNITMGLFQLDTGAASNALSMFKPSNFKELTAFIALDRPGPRIYLPSYSRRLKGIEKTTYLCPELESVLKETYGIMIYQEQIMLVARVFAGFSFAEADLLRRACSKKKKDEMAKLKDKFVKGSLKKRHNLTLTNSVYDAIERFANYGFNKSHSVAYAMITAQTGYLKAYYAPEFYASILEAQYSKKDAKFAKYVSEIKNAGVDILLPNINESTKTFDVINNKLLIPLTAINNFQGRIVDNIIEERNNHGKFKDFLDFIIRMSHTQEKITDNQVSKLIDSGAFDTLNNNRKSLKLSTQLAIEYAKLVHYNEEQLFTDDFGVNFKYTEVYDDPDERLENEFDALGVMLSDTPLKKVYNNEKYKKLSKINNLVIGKTSTIALIFRSVKKINTKNNKSMCFITGYDELNDIDITLFSDKYEFYAPLINALKRKDIIIVTGRLEENKKSGNYSFVLDKLEKFEG
ncbi:MAG: DNA polymerase III subunit alpha [Bacilli bacterium]